MGGRFYNLVRSGRGDVLLEYVVVTMLIILPLVAGFKFIFNAGGGAAETMVSGAISIENPAGDDYGMAGNQVVRMFRRTFCGLSLPVP